MFDVSDPIAHEQNARQKALNLIQARQRGKSQRAQVEMALQWDPSMVGDAFPRAIAEADAPAIAPTQASTGDMVDHRAAGGLEAELTRARAQVTALEDKLRAANDAHQEVLQQLASASMEVAELSHRANSAEAQVTELKQSVREKGRPSTPDLSSSKGNGDFIVGRLQARLDEQGKELQMLKEMVKSREAEGRVKQMQITQLRRRQASLAATKPHRIVAQRKPQVSMMEVLEAEPPVRPPPN